MFSEIDEHPVASVEKVPDEKPITFHVCLPRGFHLLHVFSCHLSTSSTASGGVNIFRCPMLMFYDVTSTLQPVGLSTLCSNLMLKILTIMFEKRQYYAPLCSHKYG